MAEHRVRIQLCGALALEVDGRRLETNLPGRQGRLLFAYLVLHRLRPVRRDELVDALWPGELPAAADVALRALLSKLRRLLPAGALERGSDLRLVLPPDSRIDLEVARAAIHRAESARAREEWARVWGASQAALFTARRGFLGQEDAHWVVVVRGELEALYLRALECYAQASLGLGGAELAAAERAGRELVRASPYRESAYRLLMQALARSGNRAEALRVYDALRIRLRDELGAFPSPETVAVHALLLGAREEPGVRLEPAESRPRGGARASGVRGRPASSPGR